MKKNTIDFQQPKWMGFLFLFILNLGVSLNSWGQIEEVPQPMEDAKDIYYSGAISRPTYKDSDPDKFKTNVPGDEITIKVKQEEGSICAGSSSEKVYLEMQVSSIPFSDFTGAEMSQNGDDLKGDLLDDSNLLIVYYREFIKAPTRGDVKSFTFKINECSIDNKIYVRIRNHERRCAVNKFRYSSWRDRTFTIAKSGQFNKGVNTEHEVKCGDEPYDGIVPKFYSLPFNDATSSVSAPQPADNSTIISWYRDYNIGNHNEPTDHHALANTQGAAVFKPSMAYNNDENNPESKKTSFWRYKAQNDCDIDDLSPYANRAGSDLNLPAPPEVKGFAAFIRYDIQGNLDDLFGITEVNLYDTDGLECAEEIKCNIENLNKFTLNYIDVRRAITSSFGQQVGIDRSSLKYYGQDENGNYVEDGFMDVRYSSRIICFDHLIKNNGIPSTRRYKVTANVTVEFPLTDYCHALPPSICNQTMDLECQISMYYDVIPHEMPNPGDEIDNETAREAYNRYLFRLEQVLDPITGLYNCDDINSIFIYIDQVSERIQMTLENEETIDYVDQCEVTTPVVLPQQPKFDNIHLAEILSNKDIAFRWLNGSEEVGQGFYYPYPNLPVDTPMVYDLQASILGAPFETVHSVKVYKSCREEQLEASEAPKHDGPVIVSIKGVENSIEDTTIVFDPREEDVAHKESKARHTWMNQTPKMVLYPNPTHKGFNINITNQNDAAVEIAIYSIQGVLVDQITSEGGNHFTYEKDLAPGTYLVKLVLEGKMAYQKLVVN